MTQNNFLKTNNKLLLGAKTMTLNAPNFVFIPTLIAGKNASLKVEVEEVIKAGQVVAQSEDGKLQIISPINGRVKRIEEKQQANGKFCMTLQIENDFTKIEPLARLIKPSVAVLNKRIVEAGISELLELNTEESVTINTLDTKATLSLNKYVFANFTNQILKGAQLIKKALGLKEIEIAVTEKHFELISEKVKKLNLKGVIVLKYKNPKKIKGQVLDLQTPLNFYEAVNYGQLLVERLVAVAGESIKNPSYYLIKNGTSLEEIMDLSGGLKHIYKEIEDFKDQATMALNDELQIKIEIKEEKDPEEKKVLIKLLETKKKEAKGKIYKYFKENQIKYQLCLANMMFGENNKLHSANSITNSVGGNTSSILFLSNREYKRRAKNNK